MTVKKTPTPPRHYHDSPVGKPRKTKRPYVESELGQFIVAAYRPHVDRLLARMIAHDQMFGRWLETATFQRTWLDGTKPVGAA